MVKLLIALPMKSRAAVSKTWGSWMAKVYDDLKESNIDYEAKIVEGKFYDEARNELAQYAVDNEFTHLFFIDDDIFIPMKGIQQLLENDKDIVGFPYFSKEVPFKSCVFPYFYFYAIPKLPRNKMMKIAWIATGAMMIKTEVFKKMEKPWFSVGGEIVDEFKGTKFNYHTSEDEYFCRKASKLGIDVYANTSNICEHYCSEQNMFFPSLSTIDPKGNVVYGDFFSVWEDGGDTK